MNRSGDGIRRVVTAHDGDGKAVVIFDGLATNARVRQHGGIRSTLVWTTGETPARESADDRGAVQIGVAPPARGSAFRIVDFPPYREEGLEGTAVLAEMGLHAPAGRRPPRHPLMHATDSVDYAIVLEGEIDMLLDEGEIHLRAGDVLVQQRTNHAWVNRGDRPCRIAFVLIGAEPPPS